MRILLFSGKGGVGKTSVAAATAVRLAELGKKTLVMSVDPAHSLADAFELEQALFHGGTGDPQEVRERLFLQEVNINREMKRHWKEVSMYVAAVLRKTGLDGIEAEEMAIFPGMEELSAMMYVNQYRKSGEFEVVVLDCAPTAESLRFISLPATLDWYMKHVFGFQRSLLKAVRPLANRLAPVEMPPDSYFKNVQELFQKIEGIDQVLEDPAVTSARLVTNAERMVLRETQRAFVYFTLHGLTVDSIIVNRLIPKQAEGAFFAGWQESQQQTLGEIVKYFAPVEIRPAPLFASEVMGYDRLREMARVLYREDEDPAVALRGAPPYSFVSNDGRHEVLLDMPFAQKAEIGLFKKGDELIVEVGTIRRHIGLPTTMAAMLPVKARLEGRRLVVEMRNAE